MIDREALEKLFEQYQEYVKDRDIEELFKEAFDEDLWVREQSELDGEVASPCYLDDDNDMGIY